MARRARCFSTRWIPIVDPRGKVLQWYASSTDVEELERADVHRNELAGQVSAVLGVTAVRVRSLSRESGPRIVLHEPRR